MADITLKDLTQVSLNGNGVFDKLMAASNAHLGDQYDKNRIKGTDYANVYLGVMSAVLAQSVQFLLQEQTADKQADLLAQQILNAQKEGALLDAQIAKINAEIALLGQKLITESAQTEDVIDGIPVVGILGKQKELYEQQKKGFKRDSEQKAAKMYLDSVAVRASNGLPVEWANAGLHDADVKAMLDIMKAGVNNDD